MRTTTITITIEARANSSESRIREAIMADVDELFRFRRARSTEDGRTVYVTSVEPQESIERIVKRGVR